MELCLKVFLKLNVIEVVVKGNSGYKLTVGFKMAAIVIQDVTLVFA